MLKQHYGKKIKTYISDYVVFDLETTGGSPRYDAIIEIGAVKVRDGKVVDTFSMLVDPHVPIHPAASAVNHITDEMVYGQADISEALEKFLAFIEDFVLVGHNISVFDMKLIWRDSWNLWHKYIGNDYADTLPLSRKCLPELPHHRLVDLAEYYHVDTAGAHRALKDCMMNQAVFEELGKMLS